MPYYDYTKEFNELITNTEEIIQNQEEIILINSTIIYAVVLYITLTFIRRLFTKG